jgi:hypothetical protein
MHSVPRGYINLNLFSQILCDFISGVISGVQGINTKLFMLESAWILK